MTYEDLVLGLELGVLSIVPFMLAIVVWLFWRFTKRHHVWLDYPLKSGRVIRKKYLPKNGMIETPWGIVKLPAGGTNETFKGRPMFRGTEGFPYTLVYRRERFLLEVEDKDKDGKVTKKNEWQEVVNPLPAAPDGLRISTHLKNHLFREMYEQHGAITLLLIIVAALGVLTLLAVVIK